MPTFKITRTYKHTEAIEIEAADKFEALAQAQYLEFDRNHDDWLYSEDVKEV